VLLISGVAVFGLSYIPSMAVAAESTRSEDRNLWAPIAGPWIDLAARPSCGGRLDCDVESLNRALLVSDGIFQGLGVLGAAASFFVPERGKKVVWTAKNGERPSVYATPARVGQNGYGVAAFGDF
jgi:hypothetical protein